MDRVSFVYPVRVFRVLMPLCCVSWVFLVFRLILFAFDLMDGRVSSVYVYFLVLLQFSSALVEPCFLYGSGVFSSISLLFIVVCVFFNVMDVAVMLESCVLLFSMMLS